MGIRYVPAIIYFIYVVLTNLFSFSVIISLESNVCIIVFKKELRFCDLTTIQRSGWGGDNDRGGGLLRKRL